MEFLERENGFKYKKRHLENMHLAVKNYGQGTYLCYGIRKKTYKGQGLITKMFPVVGDRQREIQ